MNIMVSATDNVLEHYAVSLFKSYKKFNPNTPMYCICKDVSDSIVHSLEELGVTCLKINKVEGFTHMRNISVLLGDILQFVAYRQLLWLDVDALVLSYINDVFDYKEALVALPGNTCDGWKYRRRNGQPYFALGVFKVKRAIMEKITSAYKESTTEDEGCFIRDQRFQSFRQLEGVEFNVGRTMIADLKYLTKINKLIFINSLGVFYPKVIHFSIAKNGARITSREVKKWEAFNGIQ